MTSTLPPTDLQEIPLDIALKVSDLFTFDCYIKLPSGRMVKVSGGEGEDIIDIFEKYKAKGVDKFYATKEDLLHFLKVYQKTFSQKIFNPSTTKNEKVETLSNTFDLVKQTFKGFGMDALIIESTEVTAKESLRFIRNVPNLFNFFKSFKANCSDEFMNIMLVNYTTSIILEKFDWSSSEVKKKLSLAVLLADITLTKEDLVLLHQYEMTDPDQLPEHIYNHPLEIAEIIRSSRHYGVPPEVAQIIEQHHELPFQKGFPNKLDHSRVTLFSAINIVSYHFIKEVQKYDFDYNNIEVIISNLSQMFSKGNYYKILKILIDILK